MIDRSFNTGRRHLKPRCTRMLSSLCSGMRPANQPSFVLSIGLVWITLLACAGCAARTDRTSSEPIIDPGDFSSALRLSSWTPPPGQKCAIVSGEKLLPSVAEITDSVALHRAISEHWANAAAVSGSALFSIRFDSIGAVIRRIVLESTLDVDAQLALAEMVADHLHAPPADKESRLHLRIDASAEPEMHIGWSTKCLPQLRNKSEIVALLDRIAKAVGRDGRTVLDMWISPTGRVTKVEIARTSGETSLDQYLIQVGYRMVFFPAMVDRVPVGLIVRKALNVEVEF